MNINITQEQYVALKSLVLKYEALNETTNTQPKESHGTKPKKYSEFELVLMDTGVFSISDLDEIGQRETLEMYKRYYKALGHDLFQKVLKRVKYKSEHGNVKNIKAYALTSLKQEQATKK